MGAPNGFSDNLPLLSTNTSVETSDNNFNQAALPGLDLLGIACQLRSQNQELLKIILRLEKGLEDSQQQLQEQMHRLDAAEIARRQTQVSASQLASQLEASHKEARQQQLQVETLTEQLAASQEHISQLEEHCLLLQQNYQNQAEQRDVAEKQMLDLRAILQFAQPANLQPTTKAFSAILLDTMPIDNFSIYLELLPALPVNPENWSLPILPSLTATYLPNKF
jgi:hypothetical protein